MSPEGLSVIGPLGVSALAGSGWNVQAVGGLTLGADPVSYAHALPLRAFTVRKQAKEHGTGKLIEGPFREGDRVAVIEDVITTGGSALKAIQAVRDAGGTVAGVLALVDREEGGRAAIETAGVPVLVMARVSEILAHLPPEPQPVAPTD